MMELDGRKIIVGVSAGIAAYKAATLVRLLKGSGAEVQVIMTADACRFITPLTLGTLSEREVLIGLFPENESGSWTRHVHLGLWADLMVIAPATAQTMAKLAHGFCDSMLTAVALSARCPVLVCPSMDHDMYRHVATQRNMGLLREAGYDILEPEHGQLASGLTGEGRLPDPEVIATRVRAMIAVPRNGLLTGKKVLVTAGPTREHLDPVRFMSNPSTGTMGYELARAAEERGADVVLVSGPTHLTAPRRVRLVAVETAAEMRDAVEAEKDADIVIMAAAVADYAPEERSGSKIKKSDETLAIRLVPTVDILAGLGETRRDDQLLVGFAMETDNVRENAQRKLQGKNLDWIILNDLREAGAGFGTETNRVTMFGKHGEEEEWPLLSKRELAERIVDRLVAS